MQHYYPILSVSHPEIKKKELVLIPLIFFVLFFISSYFIIIIFFFLSQALGYWEKRNEKIL